MNELATQFALVVGVLATFFIGPGFAIAFLQWRKQRARARRRSPINIDLLRGPGHTLRGQIDDTASDLMAHVAMLFTLPLMILALYLAQGHVFGPARMTRQWPLFLVFVVIVVVGLIIKMHRIATRLDTLRAGFDAEFAVGQVLDQLMRQGAIVFHDFPAENFNIDHVVVSTQGVFAVETKGYTKLTKIGGRAGSTVVYDGQTLKFPTWATREPLEQALRQAQWLEKWTSSAIGEAIRVEPVVALPGWFVERSGRGAVRVFSGKELVGLLRPGGPQPLLSQQVQRVAHQIDQRCRTVVPTYRHGGQRS